MSRRTRSAPAARRIARAALRGAPVVVVLAALQAVTIVATAAATGSPIAALACSVGVLSAAAAGWARLRAGRRTPAGRWRRRALGLAVAALVVSTLTYLRPTVGAVPAVRGTTLLLSDGARLDVRRYAAPGSTDATVVAVHGGPGVPFSPTEESILADLADTRTVVTYDQIGVGASSRLADPTGYTLQRSVDDLGQVLATAEAGRLILLGYSWGALTAVTYAARHPGDVAALILVSPGPFPWKDRPWPTVAPQDRLPTLGKARLYGRALTPRNLFAYALTAVDPVVAHWFAGDAEMDARFADLYRLAAPGTTCDPKRVEVPVSRLGYYAAQVPQLDPGLTGVDPEALDVLRAIPTLVVRGSCDYVDAAIARTYRDELGGRLVEIRGAGHAIAVERPEELIRAIETFLDRVS